MRETQRQYRLHIKSVMKIQRSAVRLPDPLVALRSCQRGRFCCLWGCSELEKVVSKPAKKGDDSSGSSRMERRVLSFLTWEECQKHVDEYHDYGRSSITLEPLSGEWRRVAEGNEIKYLCSDLTSAIMARCPDLAQIVHPTKLADDRPGKQSRQFCHGFFQKRTTFDYRKLLDLSMQGKGTPRFTTAFRRVTSVTVRGLLRLWSRVFRLFALEGNGTLRISDEECHKIMTGEDAALIRKISGEKGNKATVPATINDASKTSHSATESPATNGTKDQNDDLPDDSTDKNQPKSLSPHHSLCPITTWNGDKEQLKACLSCPLCALPSEAILRIKRDKTKSSKQQKKDENKQENPSKPHGTRHPIGCAVLSESSFPNFKGESSHKFYKAIKQLIPFKGELTNIKILLLRVASQIPNSLEKRYTGSTSCSTSQSSKKDMSLWKEPYLTIWIDFVVNSINARMLQQCVIVLLSSLNVNKFPRWFKASRAGWTSACMTVTQISLSQVAMRILVLDLALAESLVLIFRSSSASRKKSKDSNRRSPLPSSSQQCNKGSGSAQPIDVQKSLERLHNMSTKKRMETVTNFAIELSLRAYEGESNNLCEVCNEGGDLMCCEYCNTVIHMQCCRPALKKLPDYDWICNDCVVEINRNYVETLKWEENY